MEASQEPPKAPQVPVPPRLSAKQEKALAALLVSPTIGEAAQSARVGETTLFRWLQEPAFQEAYRAARLQVLSAATVACRSCMVAADSTCSRAARYAS